MAVGALVISLSGCGTQASSRPVNAVSHISKAPTIGASPPQHIKHNTATALQGFRMFNAHIGWLWTVNVLYKTNDGGKKWLAISKPVRHLEVVSASTLWGAKGHILYHSMNSGKTWTKTNLSRFGIDRIQKIGFSSL